MTIALHITPEKAALLDHRRCERLREDAVAQFARLHQRKVSPDELEHWSWYTPRNGDLIHGFRVAVSSSKAKRYLGVKMDRDALYDQARWRVWSGALTPGDPPTWFEFTRKEHAHQINRAIYGLTTGKGEYRIYMHEGVVVAIGLHAAMQYMKWLLITHSGPIFPAPSFDLSFYIQQYRDNFQEDEYPKPLEGVWRDGGLHRQLPLAPETSNPDFGALAYALAKIQACPLPTTKDGSWETSE